MSNTRSICHRHTVLSLVEYKECPLCAADALEEYLVTMRKIIKGIANKSFVSEQDQIKRGIIQLEGLRKESTELLKMLRE